MSHVTDLIDTACTAQCTVDTPLGPVLLARTSAGLAGAWFEGQKHHPGALAALVRPDDSVLKTASEQLRRYFAGDRAVFELPLDLLGTTFQQAVWRALLAIPLGTTSTYAAIARTVATASAVRAVGGAVGRNPLSVIVPCHRVLGSDGSMTGYAGGTNRKLALLKFEAQNAPHPLSRQPA